jgi:DNA-binding transcriptional LysR family regulator
LDSRKLRYFVEVVEHNSLNKAAVALRISQPALTKSITLLEEELQVRLLDRTGRGVFPTLFGKSLFEHAKGITAAINHAEQDIKNLRNEDCGVVSVGVLPTLGNMLAPAISRFTADYPNHLVRIIERYTYELIPMLRRGEIDFAVGRRASRWGDGLKQRKFLSDRFQVIVRSNHPLLKLPLVTAPDLVKFPWIFPLVGGEYRPWFEELFTATSIDPPRHSIECTSLQLTKSILLSSHFVTVLPQHVMDLELRLKLLSTVKLARELPLRSLAIIRRSDSPSSTAVKALTQQIERTAFREPVT